MIDVLRWLVALAMVVAVVTVVVLHQRGAIPASWFPRIALGLASLLVLVMLLDWPLNRLTAPYGEETNDLGTWPNTVTALLIAGVAFFGWQARQEKNDELRSATLTSAGLAGIVDHLTDVEILVAVVDCSGSGEFLKRINSKTGLRGEREAIQAGGVKDPRVAVGGPERSWSNKDRELLDLAIRRLVRGMGNWSGLIGSSADGELFLIELARIRRWLAANMSRPGPTSLSGSDRLPDPEVPHAGSEYSSLDEIRRSLRLLCFFAEFESGAKPMRDGVLLDWAGCVGHHKVLDIEAKASARWRKNLRTARDYLAKQPVEPSRRLTLLEVEERARQLHAGQVDKQDRSYFDHHVQPIALSLGPDGDYAQHVGYQEPYAQMAGYLHDVVEDTGESLHTMRIAGVPTEVISAVEAVTKRPNESYEDLIQRAAAHPLGRLVKLADNQRNLDDNDALRRDDQVAAGRLLTKYTTARTVLRQALVDASERAAGRAR